MNQHSALVSFNGHFIPMQTFQLMVSLLAIVKNPGSGTLNVIARQTANLESEQVAKLLE